MSSDRKMVKVFVERVFDVCDFNDVNEVFVEWFMGHLMRGGYGFRIDDERGGDVVVFEVWPKRVRSNFDVFEFVVGEGEYIVDAVYHIGAFVVVSVCNEGEDECVNLYWKDVKRMLSDELPIVEP